MFKLKTIQGELVKDVDVYNLCDYIENHKGDTFQFFHGYRPLSTIEFTKMFLTETGDVDLYIRMEALLHDRIDMIDYYFEHLKNA
jgi:hypothetical protein